MRGSFFTILQFFNVGFPVSAPALTRPVTSFAVNRQVDMRVDTTAWPRPPAANVGRDD